MTRRAAAFLLALTALSWRTFDSTLAARGVQGQTPQAPVPRPFPGSVQTPSAAQPKPETAPANTQAPAGEPVRTSPADAALAGAPVYPAAEFIDSYDAGAGQRYYLYGSNTAYADIVAFYRNTLKNGGRELYRVPPMQQWDLGRFQENSMAYPPSVTVKDYTWNGSTGYLVVNGTTEKRYKTIIQIVPVTAPR